MGNEEIQVKIDVELIDKLRKKYPEWIQVPAATIVDMALRKFLKVEA